MSDRMLVEQWSFEQEGTVDVSVSGELVQEFINWLLNNHSWKEYPELLVDRAFILRKKLLEDVRPDTDPLRKQNVKRDPATGRLVKRNG